FDGDQFDREERAALRRVAGLSTELADISDVEYRRLQLERVVLVGSYPSGIQRQAETSLRELSALAETAGAQVLEGVLQQRPMPDPTSYLGKGKARELADLVRELGADTVIADGELEPSQRRKLEDIVGVKVIDRTALILDIFAQHAKTREGKAQVELAQLQYLLPRLRGWGESLSRQGGGQAAGGVGIGGRGPGETKIELDRRRINSRISKLKREIAGFRGDRVLQRRRRELGELPQVAIVGYTNAGKSSLLNRLTRAGVLVENALFATLEPTVRRHKTPGGQEYALVDTVGFIRNLPHQLVEAFRSTLEEIGDSDLVLILVDASDSNAAEQVDTVRIVLAEIGSKAPQLLVFNKTDVANHDQLVQLRAKCGSGLEVAVATGAGLAALELAIESALPELAVDFVGLIPYDRGELLNRIHRTGKINRLEHRAGGTYVEARVSIALAAQLSRFAAVSTT
ncbi:MAG: GTPase HflX, partial [Actinomycetota bacterium]